MEYYMIGQFSKLVGKSIQTLRAWEIENKLKPHHVTDIKELLENDNGKKSQVDTDRRTRATTLEICGDGKVCI